jgi:hypothetical protein
MKFRLWRKSELVAGAAAFAGIGLVCLGLAVFADRIDFNKVKPVHRPSASESMDQRGEAAGFRKMMVGGALIWWALAGGAFWLARRTAG